MDEWLGVEDSMKYFDAEVPVVLNSVKEISLLILKILHYLVLSRDYIS